LPELKAAICPYCGGDLRVPEDRTTVKCMYCGKDILVRQAIQATIGPTIENYLSIARTAIASENYQEAYEYYTKILELDSKHYEAWFGKGEAAGWLSKLIDFRLPEMVTGIQNAVKFAPDDKREEIKIAGAKMISSITNAFFKLSDQHVFDYGSVDRVREEFLARCELMIKAFEVAHSYSPDDKIIIENIIYICRMLIEGIQYKSGEETTSILRISNSYESLLQTKMDEYIEKRNKLETQLLRSSFAWLKNMAEQNKSSKTVHVTDKDFDEAIHKYPLIVVDFWADWCPPCRMVAPIIEQLAQDYAGKVVFGKLNVDENPKTTSRFGVMNIPTMLFIKNGDVKDTITGAVPKPQIESKLKRLM